MELRFPNPTVLTALCALALAAGCDQAPKTPTAAPSTPPPSDLFAPDANAPTPPAPAVAPAPTAPAAAPAPTADAEPDWQKKFYAVATEQQAKFSGPKVGDTVAVKMLSGSVLQGVIEALDDGSVTLLRSSAQMKLPAANIAPESRGKLFAVDFGKLEARRIVGAERDAWLAKRKAVEDAAEAAAEAKATAAGATPGAAPRFPVPPVNGADGSVAAVKAYLKANLRDPSSLRILKWGRVEKDPKEGWRVTCIYETLGGDFGKVTESKWFFINDTGAVFQTAAFKH